MVGGLSVSLAGVIDPSTQKEVPFFVPSTIIMKMLFLFLRQLDRANLSGNHVVSLYFWPNAKTKYLPMSQELIAHANCRILPLVELIKLASRQIQKARGEHVHASMDIVYKLIM